jgi:DedD protein
MDRRVKERLIGASILVALVVLVVPELLSGPKPNMAPAPTLPAAAPEPTRNVTVDLTTSKAPANSEPEPASPQTNAAAAAPSSTSSATNSPAAQTPTAPSPVPSGAAVSGSAHVESAAPSPISVGHGSWSVQLGSFASRANADNLTRQVKGQGFSAFVLTGGSGSSVRYRVRVGPVANRESAERIAAKLKSLGHVGSMVAPAA